MSGGEAREEAMARSGVDLGRLQRAAVRDAVAVAALVEEYVWLCSHVARTDAECRRLKRTTEEALERIANRSR